MLNVGGAISWAEGPNFNIRRKTSTSVHLSCFVPVGARDQLPPIMPFPLQWTVPLNAKHTQPILSAVTFVRCFVTTATAANKVAMLGRNCFCEVFIHWTCSKDHWVLVCSRVNQRATLPTSFHPQMLPIAEEYTALSCCTCQTEGSLGRHVGTYCAQRAVPLNLLFYWQLGLLRTGLPHSPQASCHPNRWAQG